LDQILIGKGDQPVHLLSKYGNRHGLVAGATGTGKTISLLVMAEGFSRLGVPVFMADVKGDVAGLAVPGVTNDRITERIAQIGIEGYVNEPNPVVFWDLYGKLGHPVRTTVSEMGPTLLGRILELNDVQSGILEIAFKMVDDEKLLLLDLDDLLAVLTLVSDNRKAISAKYGLVSPQSLAAIQRSLLTLEREGGEELFGKPLDDRPVPHRSQREGDHQRPGRRPVDPQAAAVLELPAVAVVRVVRVAAGSRRSRQAEAGVLLR
jgi:DNA helicase HerA-like ATPase